MNQTIKNVLGGVISLAVLALGYAAVNYVSYYGKSIQPSSFRSFSVTGSGKATAIPDIAEFNFEVITQGGMDISSLQTKNTDAANKVINFVKSEGVADKDIKTQYYNVDPRYETYSCRSITPLVSSSGSSVAESCPPSSIVGYTVTQSVDVKIRDFSKIGDIMGGVVTNGANQVGSLSFTIDDITKVQADARAEAIAKAKVQAEEVAAAGGFKLGRLLNIQEGYNPYPVYYKTLNAAAGMSVASTAAPSPSIQAGSQEVDVNVTMQYEIE
jgi:uncharacterized protein YggE